MNAIGLREDGERAWPGNNTKGLDKGAWISVKEMCHQGRTLERVYKARTTGIYRRLQVFLEDRSHLRLERMRGYHESRPF